MWFYKGIKSNIRATKQKTAVAQKLQNKAYTNNHSYCRIYRKFIKLAIQHNRNIKHKIVRNSHLLKGKIGIFSSATAIVTQASINCSYAKASKQQSTAHISIVKGNHNKVLQTHVFFQTHTLIFIGVINLIEALPKIEIN